MAPSIHYSISHLFRLGFTFLVGCLLLTTGRRACAQSWELLARTQGVQHTHIIASAVTANEEVVVVGSYIKSMKLQPTASWTAPTTYNNGFVARLSADGRSWRWVADISSTLGAAATMVTMLPDGDVLVAGAVSGGAQFGPFSAGVVNSAYEGFVARLNGATGQWRWLARLTTPLMGYNLVRPDGLALRGNGEAVVVGTFSGTTNLGSLPALSSLPTGSTAQNWNFFVARLDVATGQWLQAFGVGGAGADHASGVVALPGGDVALTGALQGSITLNGLPPLPSTSVPQPFVGRLDPVSAQWRWVQRVESTSWGESQQLIVLPDGNLVASGRYQGAARVAAVSLPNGPGPTSSFVTCLTAEQGQVLWAASGAGTGRPMGAGGLCATPAGNVVVTASYSGAGQFGTLPPAPSVSHDGPDIFVGEMAGTTGLWNWVTLAGGDGGAVLNSYPFAGDDFAGSVHALSNQQLLVSGTFSNQARLGNDVGPLTSALSDGFVARLNAPAPCSAGGLPAGLRLEVSSTACWEGRLLRAVGVPRGSALTWSTGATADSLVVTASGTYYLTVRTLAGCTYQLASTITADELRPSIPPNIITPNGDQLNDQWVVPNLAANTHAWLYNRWGRLVYEAPAYDNHWAADGLPAGIYYYVLQRPGRCPRASLKGWVEVVR
ncbi:gliding motility-associated C-terminal domain-containing protein [Hymenobacter persicinus]|uniref:Gliding motility-associated C-terminal domain-containing protein n=1 Tax=Hymenobacter persicinus TaxID=2025506 RepID=A0A4Q5L8E8_9BACT|nr:gliding motility-associated C-terminal domain-containing protein [Hymenobacter persicinus]RYU75838.1 gliding motility-associated C-terminal domain-containing protein [Hymenobacter persicinus]